MAEKPATPDDPYARDSFTLRRMTRGQVVAIAIAALLIVIGLVVYVNV